MKLSLGLGAISFTVLSSNAHPTFVARVPNGNQVAGVAALGHVNTVGGGATNAFGESFKAAGYEWTRELCEADSDRDGASNGEELGDPCCTWTAGAGFGSASPSTTQSSPTHPGVPNSFTESQLASMTCNGGEATVNAIVSSDTAASTSSASASGSQLSDFGDTSKSGSLDDMVALEDQSRATSSPTPEKTSPTSETSDANQLKTFVYCFSIVGFVLVTC
ncbi:hypothetical protein KXD40_008218 [Peronospora effusa]|uniref:Temptin Cys/Cys disulfide domain-containing protein n=1 Tax=Peronospora effusa TaxID=542832 RepID=A0A3M6V938_9STRA|nr:hypothetical protein DD238_004337 [Peronospora effusa]RQM17069.1 hypothetical protein DD237_001159 [Peronospora effusa]UIZ24168.1 hypothetical protein KXD40_008218 [Peronospora effusa]